MDNKEEIIWKFLGIDNPTDGSYGWTELMFAVDEIEQIRHQKYGRFIVTIEDDCCTIRATNQTKENTYHKIYCAKNKYKSVTESLILFLEWYETHINKLNNE